MTDDVETAITEAAQRRQDLIRDIDEEIEKGRWFVHAKGTEREAILTGEEMKAAVLSNEARPAEEYTAVVPEAEMMAAMQSIKAAQAKIQTILQKTVGLADPLETPRV